MRRRHAIGVGRHAHRSNSKGRRRSARSAAALCLAISPFVNMQSAHSRTHQATTTSTSSYASPSDCGAAQRVVRVSTSTGLTRALSEALPGDVIWLETGTYSGRFVASRAGTATAHVTLCGTSGAILDAGTVNHYYTLYLNDVAFVDVRGITVQRGLKGIMADQWTDGTIDGVTVRNTGEEAIHLRRASSDDTISNSRIDGTGVADLTVQPDAHHDGEGIYVGSAYTNWAQVTGGAPDASNDVHIVNNVITGTTAESVDIKEGTIGGTIVGNTFDGAGMDPLAADSWVDVKGNNYLISHNNGIHAPSDGFQTHIQLPGWGNGNVFTNNTATVDAPGYGFRVKKGSTGNVVGCDNSVTFAASGFANVTCS